MVYSLETRRSLYSGQNFVEIVKLFNQARSLIPRGGTLAMTKPSCWMKEVRKLHPKNRFLDTGFYDYNPDMVK